jgi:Fur family peroxide stress response transcriptional regulator
MNIKKYKETRQRQLILAILKGTHSHPTADSIYQKAKKQIPHISIGTVYRNLAILLEKDEAAELNLSGTMTRYEAKRPFHYHFRCDQCDKVVDVDIPEAQDLNHVASLATGFRITHHQMEFRGLCQDCDPIQGRGDSLNWVRGKIPLFPPFPKGKIEEPLKIPGGIDQ